MIALDTNILIYACDKSDPARQQTALDLVANTTDGVIPWQVACDLVILRLEARRISAWPSRSAIGNPGVGS